MWRKKILMYQKTIVRKWISNNKYITYLSNSDKSGNRKTIVANKAIERMWLDTTALHPEPQKQQHQSIGTKVGYKH